MSLEANRTDGGRKYAALITAMRYTFTLAFAGLIVAAIVPAIAQYVAAIVGTFGLVLTVSLPAFFGAHAAKDWQDPKADGEQRGAP